MIELRRDGGTTTISGVASVFGTWYTVGGFKERVVRGAFTDTLARSPDTLLTLEHDRSRAIARTPDTLKLTQDRTGLHFSAEVDATNDSDARTAISRIERGTAREASFAFRIPNGGDSWNKDYSAREINQADIHRGDVSIVAFGASAATSTAVQRAFAGSFEKRRQYARAISVLGLGGAAVLRQVGEAPDGNDTEPDNDEDMVVCLQCGGRGRTFLNAICTMCKGTGFVPRPEDDGDEPPARSSKPPVFDARLEEATARSRVLEAKIAREGGRLTRQHRGATPRDRQESIWITSLRQRAAEQNVLFQAEQLRAVRLGI